MVESRVPAPMSQQNSMTTNNNQTRLFSNEESLPAELCKTIFGFMVRSRALEERMIQMTKSGRATFWVGGPGEEACNVCLGMNINKGCGPEHDYLHLHYRNTGVLIPMGLDLIEGVRQILSKVTDVNSMGRNFVSHYARHHANVIPVSSVIEVQHTMAPGTALVQKRCGGNGVSVVVGGDAGAAEGDFTSCLNWCTRVNHELPVLIIVMNNGWGISTSYHSQYGDRRIIDLASAFGITGEQVDGNDPIASWHALQRAMKVCRDDRRPYLIEARVSRLYGHSSASGANRDEEPDCVAMFRKKLIDAAVMTSDEIKQIESGINAELDAAVEQAMQEPDPSEADLRKHTYAPSPVDAVYPDDFDGLPE